MRKFFLIPSLIFATYCMAQTEVTEYVPGLNAEGVTYFLPQTVVDITIETEKVTYTPGEFCNYANKFLRTQGISNKPDTHWNIKRIEIALAGIADPNKAFTIKLKDKSIASLVELAEDGVLLSINATQEPDNKKDKDTETIHSSKQLNPKELLSEEILSATSTAKMAELVAREIYNIRDSRNSIIRGQADNMPKDGEALKLILKNLDEQEAALISMFEGTTETEQRTLAVRLTPGDKDQTKQILFRFSRLLGVVDADDLSGAPIYYDIENLTNLPQPDEKSLKKAKRPQGVVYNLPGKALLRIYQNSEVLYEEEIPVAQYGQTDVLANELFNKGVDTKITFDPATGGIRKIDR